MLRYASHASLRFAIRYKTRLDNAIRPDPIQFDPVGSDTTRYGPTRQPMVLTVTNHITSYVRLIESSWPPTNNFGALVFCVGVGNRSRPSLAWADLARLALDPWITIRSAVHVLA